MNIVITGGAGFIGSHLVDWVVRHSSAQVRIVDNLARGNPEFIRPHLGSGRAVFIKQDIRDLGGLRRVMRDAEIVFHLAAQSNDMGAVHDIGTSFSTNVVGTFNVLLAAQECRVDRVIFASSREVYGQPSSLPVLESHPLQPKNAYGASKVAGEIYCDAFRRDRELDVRILRLANVYGPRDRGRVIPLFCERALRGEPLVLYGGTQVLDFVWIGDVLRALWEVARLSSWDGPINVGTGAGVTIFNLATQIKEIFRRPNLPVRFERPREVEVSRFVADTRRMRAKLGWAPEGPPMAHLLETALDYAGHFSRNGAKSSSSSGAHPVGPILSPAGPSS